MCYNLIELDLLVKSRLIYTCICTEIDMAWSEVAIFTNMNYWDTKKISICPTNIP